MAGSVPVHFYAEFVSNVNQRPAKLFNKREFGAGVRTEENRPERIHQTILAQRVTRIEHELIQKSSFFISNRHLHLRKSKIRRKKQLKHELHCGIIALFAELIGSC